MAVFSPFSVAACCCNCSTSAMTFVISSTFIRIPSTFHVEPTNLAGNNSYVLSVVLQMVKPAQPNNFQRLLVIRMMHLAILVATNLTGFFLYFPSAQVRISVRPGAILFLLRLGHFIIFAPLSHVRCMALFTVSLIRAVFIATLAFFHKLAREIKLNPVSSEPILDKNTSQ